MDEYDSSGSYYGGDEADAAIMQDEEEAQGL